MTTDELFYEARAMQKAKMPMTLVLPKMFKPPKGFPKGKLLKEDGKSREYAYNPKKIIAWIESMGLSPEDEE